MEAILNILTEYGPTVLAIIGAIYTCVRTIVGVTKTPVVNNKPDAQMMEVKKPVVGLLGKLFGIDLTQGRVEKPDAPTSMPKAPQKMPPTMPSMILLGIVVGFLATGCANTTTSLTPWGMDAHNQPANVSEITPDGRQKGVYQGVGATNAKIDAAGEWFMTPGTGSMIAKDGVCVYLPGDMTAENIEYDGSVFKASSLTISYSAPLKVQADAFTVAAEEIKNMTQIEATKQIAIWVEVGKITKTVADALLKYLVPTLPTGIAAPVAAPTMLDALKPGE